MKGRGRLLLSGSIVGKFQPQNSRKTGKYVKGSDQPHSSNLGEVDYDRLIEGSAQTISTHPEGAFQLFRIGDAVAARNTHAAVYDALRLVKDIQPGPACTGRQGGYRDGFSVGRFLHEQFGFPQVIQTGQRYSVGNWRYPT